MGRFSFWTRSKDGLQGGQVETCRLTVVGDPGCGKTSLIFRFTRRRMPSAEEELSALETDDVNVWRNGKQIRLFIRDTSGHEDYARVRGLAYNESNVILICFAIDCPESLAHVKSEWVPEVRHLCKGKRFILVGTKKDKRENSILKPCEMHSVFVTEKEGKKTAKSIGASAYFECSALDNSDEGKGVKRIFGKAIRESRK